MEIVEFFVICNFWFIGLLWLSFYSNHWSTLGTFVPKYLATKRWHMRNTTQQFAGLKNEEH
jgi:hypothetical protein